MKAPMLAKDIMTRARNKLLIKEPFFGVLALKLKLVEDPTCPTAWVDGMRLGYNPTWIESLPIQQVIGLICHEIMHCVFKHHTRIGTRNHKKWNEAGDHVINLGLLDENFELPEGGLWDEQYKGMSTDHVYALLPEPPENEGDGEGPTGANQPGWGEEVRQGAQTSTSEQQAEEQEWEIAVRQAIVVAKQKGGGASSLIDMIEKAIEPVVSWKEILRNFMTAVAQDDYSMRRPNRRFVAQNLFLPSLYSEGMGKVVITIDTSGSIGSSELEAFQSEINCILEDTNPELIKILYCDTQVHEDVDEFTSDDLPLKLVMRGGGGTDFTAPFNWVEEDGIQPAVFVYFTDLYGSCSAPTPDYPVLWLCTTDRTDVPFGSVVAMN